MKWPHYLTATIGAVGVGLVLWFVLRSYPPPKRVAVLSYDPQTGAYVVEYRNHTDAEIREKDFHLNNALEVRDARGSEVPQLPPGFPSGGETWTSIPPGGVVRREYYLSRILPHPLRSGRYTVHVKGWEHHPLVITR
jgi:hypothetical protein